MSNSRSKKSHRLRPKSLSPMPLPKDSPNSTTTAYALPRPKNIALNSPGGIIDLTENPLNTRSTLLNKVHELERLRKSDKVKLESLETQVSSLKTELATVRGTSKTLLQNNAQKCGGVHALYQDLFITDLKQQMEGLSLEAAVFRQQKEEAKLEIEGLKRALSQCKATVKRYRKLLAEAVKNPPSCDNTNIPRPRKSQDQKLPSKTIVSSTLKGLLAHFNAVNSSNNMVQLCRAATAAAKELANCEKSTIFIVDPLVKALYTAHFPQSQDFIAKTRLCSAWMLLHTDSNSSQEAPLFRRVEELKYPLRQLNGIALQVSAHNEPLLILQCQNKVPRSRSDSAFHSTDEALLSLLSVSLSLSLKRLISRANECEARELCNSVFSTATSIVRSLSHKDIANGLRESIPAFTDFESVGIVFSDVKSRELFVMLQDTATHEFYSDGVLRFPQTVGLSSTVFSTQAPVLIENPKLHSLYNPEIDNAAGVLEVKDIFMAPLQDWNGKTTAVLQLTNKLRGKPSEQDTQRLGPLLGMIGCCVAAANLTVEHTELTAQARCCMEKVLKSLYESESSKAEADVAGIVQAVANMKFLLADWATERKNLIAGLK